MSFKSFYATGATALLVLSVPFTTIAQSTDSPAQDEALFVPMVGACVESPTEETCDRVRAVITECGEELDDALCDVLFTDASVVFDNPTLQEEAQTLLAETGEEIATMTFEDVQEDNMDGVIEESRADAERTMLRGDENPMSHSGPPSVEED